jgi:hypothetical protein
MSQMIVFELRCWQGVSPSRVATRPGGKRDDFEDRGDIEGSRSLGAAVLPKGK